MENKNNHHINQRRPKEASNRRAEGQQYEQKHHVKVRNGMTDNTGNSGGPEAYLTLCAYVVTSAGKQIIGLDVSKQKDTFHFSE